MPSTIFARSNGTRSPERLTTTSGTSSRRSKVVNRCPQARHSRRRRIVEPSSVWRESTTLSSRWEQAGHRTSATLPPRVARCAQRRPGGASLSRSGRSGRGVGPPTTAAPPARWASSSTRGRMSPSGCRRRAIAQSVSPGWTTTTADAGGVEAPAPAGWRGAAVDAGPEAAASAPRRSTAAMAARATAAASASPATRSTAARRAGRPPSDRPRRGGAADGRNGRRARSRAPTRCRGEEPVLVRSVLVRSKRGERTAAMWISLRRGCDSASPECERPFVGDASNHEHPYEVKRKCERVFASPSHGRITVPIQAFAGLGRPSAPVSHGPTPGRHSGRPPRRAP